MSTNDQKKNIFLKEIIPQNKVCENSKISKIR